MSALTAGVLLRDVALRRMVRAPPEWSRRFEPSQESGVYPPEKRHCLGEHLRDRPGNRLSISLAVGREEQAVTDRPGLNPGTSERGHSRSQRLWPLFDNLKRRTLGIVLLRDSRDPLWARISIVIGIVLLVLAITAAAIVR